MNNITISVEIKAPAIAEAIKLLASALAGKEVPNIPAKHIGVVSKPAKESTQKVEVESKPEKTESNTITVEEIRAAVKAKAKTNRDEVKALLTEYGATSVTTLAEEHYTGFYKKLGDL